MSQLMRAACLCCLLGASAVWAQFELDLTDSAPAPAPKPKESKKAKPKKEPSAPAADAAKAAPPAPPPEELSIDLSATSEVTSVLVIPPIVKVTTSSSGGFTGFDAKKVIEKFDGAAHKRLVEAFRKLLEGRVLGAEVAMGAINKEAITVAQLRTAAGIAKLAKATNVSWLVGFEFTKTGALAGTVYDASGKPAGEPSLVAGAQGISSKTAEEMAAAVSKVLAAEAKRKADAQAKPTIAATVVDTSSSPEEEGPDSEAPPVIEEPLQPRAWFDRERPRLIIAVGPGGVLRDLSLTGSGADSLAELRNNGISGLGVYVQLNPLQWFNATAGKRYSDLELEVHYRRAFVKAEGVGGGVEGQACSMTDDDLQLRGTYRYKVADHRYGPWVGVGGGWSQERTVFACQIPLLSTTYSGVDAQLRIRQPLYTNILSLDLSGGPRFLMSSASASSAGMSLAAEAWLEAKPFSFFYARGGARYSRLQMNSDLQVSVIDNRWFFGLEAGAFF